MRPYQASALPLSYGLPCDLSIIVSPFDALTLPHNKRRVNSKMCIAMCIAMCKCCGMSKEPNVRVSLVVTDAERRSYHAAAEKLGTTVTDICRNALKRAVTRAEKKGKEE